jgi:uncharacterized membrane protein YphA (DoxX/SURF4 family)
MQPTASYAARAVLLAGGVALVLGAQTRLTAVVLALARARRRQGEPS